MADNGVKTCETQKWGFHRGRGESDLKIRAREVLPAPVGYAPQFGVALGAAVSSGIFKFEFKWEK